MAVVTAKPVPKLEPIKFKKNFTEFIGVGENGNLWVEGCDCAALAERHGCACSTGDRALNLYRRGGVAALRSGRFKPFGAEAS